MMSSYRAIILNFLLASIIGAIGIGLQLYGMWEGENFKPALRWFAEKYPDVYVQDLYELIHVVDYSTMLRFIGVGITLVSGIFGTINWYFFRKLLKLPKGYSKPVGQKGEDNATTVNR